MCFADEYIISNGVLSWIKNLVNWIFKWFGYASLAYFTAIYFSIKLSPGGVIDSDIS